MLLLMEQQLIRQIILLSKKKTISKKIYAGVMKLVNINTFLSERNLKYIQINRKER